MRIPFLICAILAAIAPVALGSPITLQNATATFSQTSLPASATIDGNLGGSAVLNGWAINPNLTNQTAVYETSSNIGGAAGAAFTFVLTQNYGNFHTLGKFRLSVTTDARSTFADGLQVGGDVIATWIELTPLTALATNGATLAIQGDHSILAGGVSPMASVYTVTASTAVTGITGIRLEVLEDPSLPFNGPGRQPTNGNFVLQEFQADAVSLVPEPASALLLAAGAGLVLFRRRNAKPSRLV
jgi:hypothetical protein